MKWRVWGSLLFLPLLAIQGTRAHDLVFHDLYEPSLEQWYLKLMDFMDDTDGDGILDRLDWDQDNDGVQNLLDEEPLDHLVWGADEDLDGIPDAHDFDGLPFSETAALLQDEIYQLSRIAVTSSDSSNDKTLNLGKEQILAEILYIVRMPRLAPYMPLDSLKTVVLSRSADLPGTTIARYRGNLRQMKLQEEVLLGFGDFRRRSTLTHEILHAVAEQHKAVFDHFLLISGWEIQELIRPVMFQYTDEWGHSEVVSEWDLLAKREDWVSRINGPRFPSDYSKLGPHEMFAECATASLLHLSGTNDQQLAAEFEYINAYLNGPIHEFFKNEVFVE